MEELDNGLSTVIIIPKIGTGKASFGMVYETEAVVPIEIAIPSPIVQHFDLPSYKIESRTYLNPADEKQWKLEETQARMRLATNRYYNKRVSA